MKLYDCKVRLYGEVKDEVLREAVTAAEIRVLRSIHGDDAVVDIRDAGVDKTRDETSERQRLERTYTERVVAGLFGIKQISIANEDLSSDAGKPPPPPLPLAVRGRPPVRAEGLSALTE